jgi:hypothetical protein
MRVSMDWRYDFGIAILDILQMENFFLNRAPKTSVEHTTLQLAILVAKIKSALFVLACPANQG